MITLKEIAKECNVSATTVSNILNGKPKVSEETKQKVLKVVKERGYQPNFLAQGLRNKKTRTIGIIAEDIVQFTTPAIIESIMACCEEKGYCTVLENLRLYSRWSDSWYGNEKAYRSILKPSLQELLSIKVDGIIYIAGHARIIDCFPKDFNIPAVMAYAFAKSPEVSSVVIGDEKGSYDMMKYLISMGHRKIGVLAGCADNIHTQKRLLGLQKALFEGKIPFNPELVRYGAWDRSSGYAEAGAIVHAGVSAIFCFSDLMARGVYDYLEEHGMQVGKDISVAGFDNHAAAEYSKPGITTMQLPLLEIGQKAAELLLNKLDGVSEESGLSLCEQSREYLMPCKFLERSSVKCLWTE